MNIAPDQLPLSEDLLKRVLSTPHGRLIYQALEEQAHTTEWFASYGRCTYGEAVVELNRLHLAGLATIRGHMGRTTWRQNV